MLRPFDTDRKISRDTHTHIYILFLCNISSVLSFTFSMLVCLKVLLANKATINAADDDGDTALIFASSQGHAQIVEVRLQM